MISISMAVWNRKKFVSETIDSVLNQTYKDFELIIVDDGSTDGVIDVLNEYAKKDKRIRVIKKEHSGSVDTFNRGFTEAKGDVICVLGSDDIWLSTKLERQVEVSKDFPDYILHNNSVSINENNIILRFITFPNETPEGYKKIALGKPTPWFVTSSWFIPKHIFDKVGLYEHIYEDYEWMMRAVLLYDIKLKLIPEFLTKHRTNPKSNTISDIGQKKFSEYAKDIQDKIKNELRNNGA